MIRYLFRRLRRLFPRRCLYCGVRVWREPDRLARPRMPGVHSVLTALIAVLFALTVIVVIRQSRR